MAYCEDCGEKLAKDEMFCQGCGTKTPFAKEKEAKKKKEQEENREKYRQKIIEDKTKKIKEFFKRPITIIIIALVIMAILIFPTKGKFESILIGTAMVEEYDFKKTGDGKFANEELYHEWNEDISDGVGDYYKTMPWDYPFRIEINSDVPASIRLEVGGRYLINSDLSGSISKDIEVGGRYFRSFASNIKRTSIIFNKYKWPTGFDYADKVHLIIEFRTNERIKNSKVNYKVYRIITNDKIFLRTIPYYDIVNKTQYKNEYIDRNWLFGLKVPWRFEII